MLIFLSDSGSGSGLAEAVARAIEGAFGSSLSDILIQIAATLVLVVVVRIFFWSRITEFLTKRRELVTKELDDAKLANEEAQKNQEKTDKKYQDLKAKSKEYLDKAKIKGEEERLEIVAKAKTEADNLVAQAHKEIDLEKQKARTEIQKEAVNLATLMASKIIEEELDAKKYEDLAVKNLERSEKV